MDSSPSPKTVIVTGANRGIGYQIVKQLFSKPISRNIIMTSRDLSSGHKILDEIKNSCPDSKSTLYLEQLDILDDNSIDSFYNTIQTKYKKIDVLVNNVGVNPPDAPGLFETIQATIKVNTLHTAKLTEKLLPLLSDDGKVIMISSKLGKLQNQGPEVKKLLSNPDLTREEFSNLVDKYLELVKKGTHVEFGFNELGYHVSKALLNTYARFVLRKLAKPTQQIYMCHPGWCRTDMGGQEAPMSAEEGASTPIYLIELPFEVDAKLDSKYFDEQQKVDDF
jgi:NAD(P)-dependent dehydrogenase (short-subunit alcohol dehydrogenase family)